MKTSEYEAFKKIEKDIQSRFYGLDRQIEQILVSLVASHPTNKHMRINGVQLIGAHGQGKTDMVANVLPLYFTKEGGKPLDVFYKQIKPEHKPSDIWVSPEIFQSLKEGKLIFIEKATKADVVFLDEFLCNPILTGLLNEAGQEWKIEGYPLQAKMPIFLATNPQNDLYQSKIALIDYSTKDRFPAIAFPIIPPSKFLEFQDKILQGVKSKPIEIKYDISIIEKARGQVHELGFGPGLQTFLDYLFGDLTYCKYSKEGEEDDKFGGEVNIWMMEGSIKQLCMQCRHGKNEEDGKVRSICSEGKTTFPRSAQQILALSRGFAWFNRHDKVSLEDIEKALEMVLPYKIYWFGNLWNKYHQPTVCFKALYASFLEIMKRRGMNVDALRRGEETREIVLTKEKDPTALQGLASLNRSIANKSWNAEQYSKLRKDYEADITVLAFLDGIFEKYKLRVVEPLKENTAGIVKDPKFTETDRKALIDEIKGRKLEENDEAELLKITKIEMEEVEFDTSKLEGEEGSKLIGKLATELGKERESVSNIVEFLRNKSQKTYSSGLTKVTIEDGKVKIETTKEVSEKIKKAM